MKIKRLFSEFYQRQRKRFKKEIVMPENNPENRMKLAKKIAAGTPTEALLTFFETHLIDAYHDLDATFEEDWKDHMG